MENKIIAKVDGREVRESDLASLMKNLGQNAAYFQGEEGRRKLIDELVMQELMFSDAVENNMDKEEEFIQVFNSMKKPMLQQYSLRKMFDKIEITEENIKNYYETHKERFNKSETVQASHILVETEEEANSILKDIKEGLSFEDAASQYSTCPSRQQGGALGEFGRGQMVSEFEDAVFAMEVGAISKPVKTQFGYHIIKLTDYSPAGSSSFEEVYQEAKDACFMEKQEQTYNNRKSELSDKYSVEIL